jgi:hypothetical protein|uniref:Uncharacterized protein n=1 Tax=Picea sitchensis TaxID=3332 RepID=A9NR59_PICSI|nr:unknown [Picea sitchensis]
MEFFRFAVAVAYGLMLSVLFVASSAAEEAFAPSPGMEAGGAPLPFVPAMASSLFGCIVIYLAGF